MFSSVSNISINVSKASAKIKRFLLLNIEKYFSGITSNKSLIFTFISLGLFLVANIPIDTQSLFPLSFACNGNTLIGTSFLRSGPISSFLVSLYKVPL